MQQANSENKPRVVRQRVMTSIEHAFLHIKELQDNRFYAIFPTLICKECENYIRPHPVSIFEHRYYDNNQTTDCWWDSHNISSFGTMIYFVSHSKTIIFVDCNYHNQLLVQQTVTLPDTAEAIIGIGHKHHHYSMIRIQLKGDKKEAVIFDGLFGSPLSWS